MGNHLLFSMDTNFEIRLLNAVRKTLISVAKDTMTKPGLRHPLTENTQSMITDCLDIITSRQIDIEKSFDNHTSMKPTFKDTATVQSITVDSLINNMDT